ncbi:MAG: UDP-N-acetylmuramoyl-tripeptide--D-alanyl-D-alanine ligase [Candidatus Schekmanbacteria bacterium]|nr:UDP-N-acetylmuramoyl-tripeptide--D-alanyl-D-alanine ligase [Candidatus Schekmanbacteria bacterium]
MRVELGRSWTLREIAALACGRAATRADIQDRVVSGLSVDSRVLEPGDLFVALPGERVDGNAFVGEALRRGAAVLCTRIDDPEDAAVILHDQPLTGLQAWATAYRGQLNAPLVGITGSVGKSTVKELIACVLGGRPRVHATPGNLNGQIGLPLALLGCSPSPRAAVLEMGISRPGEMDRLAALARPSVAVMTNVAMVHAEFFASLDEIADEKGEIFSRLEARGAAVLCADDARCERIAERLRQRSVRVVRYGTRAMSAAAGDHLRLTAAAGGPGGHYRVSLRGTIRDAPPIALELIAPLPGRHSALNVAAALAVGLVLGEDPHVMSERLTTFRGLPMRLEVRSIGLPGGGTVSVLLDAYNASPASVAAGASTLLDMAAGGRAIAVLGDMLELGPGSEQAHRNIGGLLAERGFSGIFTTGALAKYIHDGAGASAARPGMLCWQATHALLAAAVVAALQPGDHVLIKGSRGAAMERAFSEIVRLLAEPDSASAVSQGKRTACQEFHS